MQVVIVLSNFHVGLVEKAMFLAVFPIFAAGLFPFLAIQSCLLNILVSVDIPSLYANVSVYVHVSHLHRSFW